MSLKQFISLEDEQDPAGEQVTADIPLDLEPSPETTQALTEQDATLQKLEDAQEASIAIEAYLVFLQAHPEGITAQTAHAMHIGLECYGGLLTGTTGPMPSVESFGGTSSRQKATLVSIESLGEKAKSLGKTIVELIKQLIAWSKDFYANLMQDFDEIARKAGVLKNLAHEHAGQKPQSPTIEVKNLGLLYVNGVYQGNNPKLMAGLAAYLATIYPNAMATYLAGVTNVIKRVAQGNMTEGDITHAISGLTSPMSQFAKGGLGDTVFYGDARLMLKHTQSEGLASYFNYQWEMHSAQTPNTMNKVKISDLGVMQANAAAVQKIATSFSESKEANRKLISGAELFVKEVEHLQAAIDAGQLGDNAPAAAHLLTACKNLPKLLGPGMSSVYQYCHRVLIMMVAVMTQEFKAYAFGSPA